jgi:hypothetical protein
MVKRRKQPTEAEPLAYHAVRLLEILVELEPYGERALNLSRDAWDIPTVTNRLRTLQERLMDRAYETRQRERG